MSLSFIIKEGKLQNSPLYNYGGDKSPLSPHGPPGLIVMRKMCILLFCSHAFLHSISFPRPLCRIYLQNIPMNILIWSDTKKLNSYTNSTHKQNTFSKAGKINKKKNWLQFIFRKINKLTTYIDYKQITFVISLIVFVVGFFPEISSFLWGWRQGMTPTYPNTEYGHTMAKSLILCGPNSNFNPK